MRVSISSFAPLLGLVGFAFGFVGCGGGGSDGGSCTVGTYFCPCLNGQCMAGLTCMDGYCLNASAEGETGDGDGDTGDGDGDTGDGDGDTGDGDGDADTGDGDGDTGDGDGDSGDGDGDSGDGDGDGDLCELFPLSLTPPDVVFVIDTSGSMVSTTWDHDQNGGTPSVTRWYATHAALDAALDEYAPLLNAGIKRFPSSTASAMYNAMACTTTSTVEAGMNVDNAAGIIAAIPAQGSNNTQIKGAAPARAGIDAAVDHIDGQGSANTRAIVLITDGLPNCDLSLPFPNYIEDYDTQLVSTVADAFDLYDIATHVVGIAILDALVGSGNEGNPYGNPYDVLNEVALAGGAPLAGVTKFHNAMTQAQMSSSLDTILDQLACVVDLTELPEGPPTPQQVPGVEFELGGSPIPFQNDCSGGNGWMWEVSGERVRFCGSYCQQYKANPAAIGANYCD